MSQHNTGPHLLGARDGAHAGGLDITHGVDR
jgi:hypothetical protein